MYSNTKPVLFQKLEIKTTVNLSFLSFVGTTQSKFTKAVIKTPEYGVENSCKEKDKISTADTWPIQISKSEAL